ncbi:hypothetical protein D3C87_1063320 [compost metagenome]
MKKIIASIAIFFAFVVAGYFLFQMNIGSGSKPGNSAVLIDQEAALLSSAPSGWILDHAAATQMGMCAVYVLKDHNFETSPYLIYPRFAEKGGDAAITAAIQELAAIYKSHSAGFSLEEKDDYTSKQGLVFKVRYFWDGPPPRGFEAVAYLTYKEKLYISVYSTKSRDEFLKQVSSFYSYLDTVAPYSLASAADKCLYPAGPQ